jgi:hypothetical protein
MDDIGAGIAVGLVLTLVSLVFFELLARFLVFKKGLFKYFRRSRKVGVVKM